MQSLELVATVNISVNLPPRSYLHSQAWAIHMPAVLPKSSATEDNFPEPLTVDQAAPIGPYPDSCSYDTKDPGIDGILRLIGLELQARMGDQLQRSNKYLTQTSEHAIL